MMTEKDLKRMQEEQPFASLSKLIYEYFKEHITKFDLLPDTKLKESKIADEIGVSRSPVEKAINALVDDGLVVKEHHRTPRVVSADLHDCLDVCQARTAVEGEAAYLACKSISEEQLAKLEKIEEDYINCLIVEQDFIKAAQIDESFHSAIVDASGNIYLKHMYDEIKARALRYRCYLQHMIGANSTAKQLLKRSKSHDAIIKALRDGHSSVAKEEICIDINSNIDMYIMCVKSNG